MLSEITPVILTFNEEDNIVGTLQKLTWANEVLIVDSFSTDQTLVLAKTFANVRIVQRTFDNFAAQCNYAIDHGDVQTDWILNLDADYRLTDELIAELSRLSSSESIDGYRARFIYCINGRRLRSGIYPPVTVLFRKKKARFEIDGHAHRVSIDGQVVNLQNPILHDDRKPLTRWFSSQVRYTALEAEKISRSPRAELSWSDRIRRARIVAPGAMLVYCLFIRGGILDGWPGFYYAFQRTLAELMLSLYLFERPKGKMVRADGEKVEPGNDKELAPQSEATVATADGRSVGI